MSDYIKYVERKRWLFLGLPFTFTKYTIKVDDDDTDGVNRPDMLTINTGFFKTVENDCYLYKIIDVKLERSIGERLFGLGTIVCYTGSDPSDDKVKKLVHIKNSHEIKDYLLAASERARIKRRTVNMMEISDVDSGDLD